MVICISSLCVRNKVFQQVRHRITMWPTCAISEYMLKGTQVFKNTSFDSVHSNVLRSHWTVEPLQCSSVDGQTVGHCHDGTLFSHTGWSIARCYHVNRPWKLMLGRSSQSQCLRVFWLPLPGLSRTNESPGIGNELVVSGTGVRGRVGEWDGVVFCGVKCSGTR